MRNRIEINEDNYDGPTQLTFGLFKLVASSDYENALGVNVLIANNWIESTDETGSKSLLQINPLQSMNPFSGVIINNTLLGMNQIINGYSVHEQWNNQWTLYNNLQWQHATQPDVDLVEQPNNAIFSRNNVDAQGNMWQESLPNNDTIPDSFLPESQSTPSQNAQLIDAGIDVSTWIANDIDLAPRPIGDGFDIGAIESQL